MFLAILHMHRALEKIVGRQGVWADKVSKSLGQANLSAVTGLGLFSELEWAGTALRAGGSCPVRIAPWGKGQ